MYLLVKPLVVEDLSATGGGERSIGGVSESRIHLRLGSISKSRKLPRCWSPGSFLVCGSSAVISRVERGPAVMLNVWLSDLKCLTSRTILGSDSSLGVTNSNTLRSEFIKETIWSWFLLTNLLDWNWWIWFQSNYAKLADMNYVVRQIKGLYLT